MRPLRPAERLLQELGITDPEEIDLAAIAWHVGCEVQYVRLDGWEAGIMGAGDKAIISISNQVAPARRRFSLGHELGHWHHHRGKSFICRSDDIGNYKRGGSDPERVADGFAADLLLPPYLFLPRLESKRPASFKQIEELAAAFKTSVQATAIRFIEASAQPLILICHTAKGRKWFTRGSRIPDRWFPQSDLDAESYAFDVMFKAKDSSHRALMPATAWFDRGEAGRYELYEETKRISPSEVLTLLTLKDDGMLDER